MSKPDEARDRFLKDVADHRMTVLLDNGVHRHLRFSRPGSSTYWFELVTWPGRLSISGDMGDYVFSRLTDMFEFFRTDRSQAGELRINRGYWAEKVTAVSKFGNGIEEFSPERFRAAVVDHFRRHTRDRGIVPGLKQAIRDEVLDRIPDGEHDANIAVRDFYHGGFRFTDFWEHHLTDYTLHYVWCCYAIQWGIQQYDECREAREDAAERELLTRVGMQTIQALLVPPHV